MVLLLARHNVSLYLLSPMFLKSVKIGKSCSVHQVIAVQFSHRLHLINFPRPQYTQQHFFYYIRKAGYYLLKLSVIHNEQRIVLIKAGYGFSCQDNNPHHCRVLEAFMCDYLTDIASHQFRKHLICGLDIQISFGFISFK